MQYRAKHTTRYVYERPVAQCLSEARLTPREFPGQHVVTSSIRVTPEPEVFEFRKDYFGNNVAAFSIFRNHEQFETTCVSIVDVAPPKRPPYPGTSWESARSHLTLHPDDESMAAWEFTFDSPFIPPLPELADYGATTFTPKRPLAEAVQELSSRIYKEFIYRPKATSIDMPLAEILTKRQGVCQDFAHVMIGVLRSQGLAARYVSGYLRSGAKYQGAEASHAWVSAFIPGFGWLDLDPTNNVIPTDGHVTVAWGRDYGDVTPVKGIALGGGGQTVVVEVKVLPVEPVAA